MDSILDILQAIAPGVMSGAGAGWLLIASIARRVSGLESEIGALRAAEEAREARDARIEERLDETRDAVCLIAGRLGVK